MFKVAPLSSSFMMVSLIGFVISAFMLDTFPTWAFTLMFFFVLMFISSIVSMNHAKIGVHDHLEELAVHDKPHGLGYHKKK
ncbi:MAG: hypothetical protein V1725_02950 [archaeon]